MITPEKLDAIEFEAHFVLSSSDDLDATTMATNVVNLVAHIRATKASKPDFYSVKTIAGHGAIHDSLDRLEDALALYGDDVVSGNAEITPLWEGPPIKIDPVTRKIVV